MGQKEKNNSEMQDLLSQIGDVHTLMEKLAERESQLDAFFRLSHDIFMIADEQTGVIVRVNPRFHELLGWSTDETTGRPFLDFVVPEDVSFTADKLEAMVTEEQGVEGTFRNAYLSKSGSVVQLDWRSTPPKGGLIYAVARVVG